MAKVWPYIANGFKDDCMTLLAKYAATNSARFSDFVGVWQEMKFSLIYCGLNSFAELLEFTEEALNISKLLFLPPNSDISRIGALYLVYGVYTQQPTRGLAKIRMTPDDWLHTIDFISSLREYGYADANFIFHLLCYHAAFTFTACMKEYGLERAYRRHHLATNHLREMMNCKDLTTNQIIKPVFEGINIDQLEKSRTNYENSKQVLAVQGQSQGMEFTSVTPLEDVVSMLRKVVDSFTSDHTDAATSDQASKDSPDKASSSGSKDIGKDRQRLKQRAFKAKNIGQQHLKSCLSTPTSEDPSTEMPSTETPSTDMPSIDMPSTDMPSTDMPSTEMPSTEMSSTSTGKPPGVPEGIVVNNTEGLDVLRGKVYERSIFRADLKSKPKVKRQRRNNPNDADIDCSIADEPIDLDDPDPLEIPDEGPPLRRSKRSTTRLFNYSDLK